MKLKFAFLLILGTFSLSLANAAPAATRISHVYAKPKYLRKFQILRVVGKDAKALQIGMGKYLSKTSGTKIVGIRSVICDSKSTCWVLTSKADFFEVEDLVANESYDLSPFKNIDEKKEIAFLSPSLDSVDRTEEMTASSEPVFNQMTGRNVIYYKSPVQNGQVESRTIRGEKIEIRCFHETTGSGDDTKHNYNCQVYAKIAKSVRRN